MDSPINLEEIIHKFNKKIVRLNEKDFRLYAKFKNHPSEKIYLNLPQLEEIPHNLQIHTKKKVKSLDINAPKLFTFPYSLIKNHNRLTYFGIASEELNELRYDFFHQKNSLIKLYLHLPSLDFFYNGIFSSLRNLKFLFIDNTPLFHGAPFSISFCKQLEQLIIQNSDLEEIPFYINSLKNLKTLNLNFNKIQKLPLWFYSSSFKENLLELDLSDNKLKEFPKRIIKEYSSLQSFSIKRNLLKETIIILDTYLQDKKVMIYSDIDLLYFSEEQASLHKKIKNFEENNYEEIPEDFICPISRHVMINPVMNSKGETYEKHYISKWYKKNKTDPLTNVKLDDLKLIKNKSLYRCIQSFFEKKI